MAINTLQLRDLVIIPTLKALDAYSESAVNLLLGTCAQESSMGEYLHQVRGPALGIFQMEAPTHDDLWKNYLSYSLKYSTRIRGLMNDNAKANPAHELITNLSYATAMCRMHYMRVKASLPTADDIQGLAVYWKRHYNTEKGKGRMEDFIKNWDHYVAPYI